MLSGGQGCCINRKMRYNTHKGRARISFFNRRLIVRSDTKPLSFAKKGTLECAIRAEIVFCCIFTSNRASGSKMEVVHTIARALFYVILKQWSNSNRSRADHFFMNIVNGPNLGSRLQENFLAQVPSRAATCSHFDKIHHFHHLCNNSAPH